MNKIVLIISVLLIFATQANALTIEMEKENSFIREEINFYDFETPLITSAFGKNRLGEKYGVFVQIELRGNEQEDFYSIFYPIKGELAREGDMLYYHNKEGGEKVLVAKKNIFGFRPVQGVSIHADFVEEGFNHYVKVHFEIN